MVTIDQLARVIHQCDYEDGYSLIGSWDELPDSAKDDFVEEARFHVEEARFHVEYVDQEFWPEEWLEKIRRVPAD